MGNVKTLRLHALDAADIKYLHQMAAGVWQECGGDCLQAIAEEKGKDPEQITIPRSTVMEIALDAGRLEENIRRDKRLTPEKKEAYARFLNDPVMSYKNKLRFFRPAFPYERYGM